MTTTLHPASTPATERPMPTTTNPHTLLAAVKARIEPTAQFGPIELKNSMLVAAAKAAADPAFYRLELETPSTPHAAPRLFISLVTPSRWLSESIESDLVEHGDDLAELIEDELIELGCEGHPRPTFQHYRSPDLLYTFRTPIPVQPPGLSSGSTPDHAETAALWMLAYEQAFRRLGDMDDQENAD